MTYANMLPLQITYNPPFSIISQIVNDYNAAGVKFFMFSPYLTCMGIRNCTKIVTNADVTYANGATVNTCFVTNMEPGIIARSEPDLKEAIDKAVKEISTAKKLPKYKYPKYVVTATMLGYLSVYGVKWELKEEDGYFIRSLDSQRAVGKAIFGSGYLISEQAAAEKAAAEKVDCTEWELSQNERNIIEELTRKKGTRSNESRDQNDQH